MNYELRVKANQVTGVVEEVLPMKFSMNSAPGTSCWTKEEIEDWAKRHGNPPIKWPAQDKWHTPFIPKGDRGGINT